MTMRLVCDHCDGVINDTEFREIRRSVMTRDPNDDTGGLARGTEETKHYHVLCFENRIKMAVYAPLSAESPSPDIPDDHPIAMAAQRAEAARDETIRTTDVGEQERRGALEAKTVEELHDLASEHEIEGRSKMDKEELVSALLKAGI